MRSLLLLAGLAIALTSHAQDCTGYYFLQNNKNVEMTVYNKKGNVTGKNVYSVSDVSSSGNTTTGKIASEMFNEKGKSLAKSNASVKCEGGVMMMDMKMSMPPQQGQKSPMDNTDVKMESFYIEYPPSMKEGDALKDATMNMDINNASGMKQSVEMSVTNRKVEGKESVTTTAGTWNCFKIAFHTHMKIKMMGIGVPMNFDGEEWFAPGFGIVKTESKYGKTEITSVK